MRSRFGYAVDSLCVSGLGAATTGRGSPREKSVTLTRDKTSSESGLGPAWIRPSWRIETPENGEAAARSSKARSFRMQALATRCCENVELMERGHHQAPDL